MLARGGGPEHRRGVRQWASAAAAAALAAPGRLSRNTAGMTQTNVARRSSQASLYARIAAWRIIVASSTASARCWASASDQP